MTKNIENKTKRTLWQDVKLAAKVGVITSLLMQPVIQNVGGYISTNRLIDNMDTQSGKRYVAEFEKDCYKDRSAIMKTLTFGDYLAAEKYLNKQ